MTEKYTVKVHGKGLIVIPAEVRKKFGITPGSKLQLYVEGSSIRIVVPQDIRSLFGVDGEKALEVTRLILEERKRERDTEIRARL
ncbi:MAG: AbrB/MazE/SpoVT family DNA-binding domain-containing protein [Thermofilum sp.]|uniref:AbrB/MazE/SpoVT family DNA-binding domain-containing protein n=1 Tax=Thermofilum sp. TaxID=1961369 RepID=UPI00258A502C|nr:AbrB/MazE/SpoVT family DNA-binding domain-containing protein [Thermofilum sp.]MCC5998010.1 AbrB/MazE/SpoVT family DNA-binding domain-containing protein [Thermofilum sp.]